jgi:hypothetical protein
MAIDLIEPGLWIVAVEYNRDTSENNSRLAGDEKQSRFV